MVEREIKAFFKRQVHSVIERGASDPDGFPGYFARHEPRDEEIMGLLAVSIFMTDGPRGPFPTAAEALAALSPRSRAEICRAFRREFESRLRHFTAA